MNEDPSAKQQILCIATSSRELNIDEEVNAIEDIMRARQSRFDFKRQPVKNVEDVLDAIQRETPQIIHFCGEGKPNGRIIIPGENGKVDELKPEIMAKYFQNASHVKYVLLNYCYSSKAAELIAKHIQCVIGINGDIETTAALEFSKSFYRSLQGLLLNQNGVNDAFSIGEAAALQTTQKLGRYIIFAPPPLQEMQLIEPVEGSTVPIKCPCRGTFNNLPDGASMWAYIHATEEGKFYLLLIEDYSDDGTWRIKLTFGEEEHHNVPYKIGVFIVNPKDTPQLKDQYKKAIAKEPYVFKRDSLASEWRIFGDRLVTRQ